MLSMPDVYMWENHGIDDVVSTEFKTHLRDDFNMTDNVKGAQRRVLEYWLDNTLFTASSTL